MSGIDIENEELLTITQAATRCPGRPHAATIWRWVLNGLHGVKLDSIKVGGKRLTSAEAISRSPDSDGSDVIRRVTGVTVFDKKFVIVRGLKDVCAVGLKR